VPSGPNAGLHLLDAKFRLDKLATVMPLDDADIESPSDVAEERQGTFKRGDLYKMHTYNDAIPSAQSVWILYPGTEARFFPVDGPRLNSLHCAVLDKWVGVGAIPLVPLASPNSELATVLSSLLVLGGTAGS
jgi:predicted component of viral defense system (DUF524 family)